MILFKQFDKIFPLYLHVDLRYSEWLSNNYFYDNPMDLCVVPRVGGFRLSKLVSNLSNENKRMEVAFTHITLKRPCLHTQKLCRTLYDVVRNAQLAVILSTLFIAHIFCSIMLTQTS